MYWRITWMSCFFLALIFLNLMISISEINGRGRKMWVVHELLYASKVVVSSIGSSSHGAQLTSSAIAAPVMMGLTPGADVKVRRMGNESLEIAAEEGKKVLFGFRAISFRFDARGEVCDFKRNAGDKYPMTETKTWTIACDHISEAYFCKSPLRLKTRKMKTTRTTRNGMSRLWISKSPSSQSALYLSTMILAMGTCLQLIGTGMVKFLALHTLTKHIYNSDVMCTYPLIIGLGIIATSHA